MKEPLALLPLTVLLFLLPSPVAAVDNVAAFGDSITAGTGETPYPSHLQNLIDGGGGGAVVLNYGKRGETTNNGVARIDSVLAASLPRYIIIMEGANDVVSGLSPLATRQDLAAMLDKCIAAGSVPILSTITPNLKQGDHPEVDLSYNSEIRNLAASRGVVLVDQYNRVVANWQNLTRDGLHPNDQGAIELAMGFHGALPYGGGGGGGGDAGGDSGGGGCFMATAAFGTLVHPGVRILRSFRDRILRATAPGRSFIRAYYRISPPLARWLAAHPLPRALMRLMLVPLIVCSWLILHPASLSMALFLGIAAWWSRKSIPALRPHGSA